MATASSLPTSAPTESLAIGVGFPADFPETPLRKALGRGGHRTAFWHETLTAAVAACGEEAVDLLLLGARRPNVEMLDAVRSLTATCPETKAVLICKRSGEGDIRKALDAGARALMPVSEMESALVPVIDVVRAGQVSVPSLRGAEAGRKALTAREKQILGQVVLGMTNAEIAAKLFLAESTVKSHLSSAFVKLGVTSRNEATALILDPTTGVGLGILTIPSAKVAYGRR